MTGSGSAWGSGCDLGFQRDPKHQAPSWPAGPSQQAHLDFDVDDLEVAERAVLRLGTIKASKQPSPSERRVLLDPAGHPFCSSRIEPGSTTARSSVRWEPATIEGDGALLRGQPQPHGSVRPRLTTPASQQSVRSSSRGWNSRGTQGPLGLFDVIGYHLRKPPSELMV